MAGTAYAIRIGAPRVLMLGVCLAAACLPGPAQSRISLSQLEFRSGPNHSALYAGQRVTVRGVVSMPTFHFMDYSMLAIQDGHAGGVLKVLAGDTSLDGYRPGDELEV